METGLINYAMHAAEGSKAMETKQDISVNEYGVTFGMLLSGGKKLIKVYKVCHMSKKAYFLKKKHGKDKAEINNISYLQMVGWNRVKGTREESTLLCICFLYSFDF